MLPSNANQQQQQAQALALFFQKLQEGQATIDTKKAEGTKFQQEGQKDVEEGKKAAAEAASEPVKSAAATAEANATVAEKTSQVEKNRQDAEKSKAEIAQIPGESAAKIAEARANGQRSIAEAHKFDEERADGGTPAEMRQEFNSNIKDLRTQQSTAVKAINDLQKRYDSVSGSTTKSVLSHMGMGDNAKIISTQMTESKAQLKKINSALQWMNGQQEAVVKGKAKLGDTVQKAYEMAGLGFDPSVAGGDSSTKKPITIQSEGKTVTLPNQAALDAFNKELAERKAAVGVK